MCVCVCVCVVTASVKMCGLGMNNDSLSLSLSALTGGCSDHNGGCNQFCFTVPASSGDSLTDPECDCITGIELNTALEQPQCATSREEGGGRREGKSL